MGLQRVKTLEVEQRVDEARGGGIAVVDRDQIGAESIADVGLLAQCLVIGLADQIARQCRMVETIRQAMDHRVLEPIMMQHRRVDEGGELRLMTYDIFGLDALAVPDRIKRRQFSTLLSTLRINLMHRHGARSERFWPGLIARR